MMAIPRAYFLMGWVLGTTILLVVAYLTYWTLSVLVDATEETGMKQMPGTSTSGDKNPGHGAMRV